jgi:ferredoxin
MRVSFDASNETILLAALEHGLVVPFGCGCGTCGNCKIEVLDGDIDVQDDYDPRMLTDDERRQGRTLACVTRPRSDVTVEWLQGRRNKP